MGLLPQWSTSGTAHCCHTATLASLSQLNSSCTHESATRERNTNRQLFQLEIVQVHGRAVGIPAIDTVCVSENLIHVVMLSLCHLAHCQVLIESVRQANALQKAKGFCKRLVGKMAIASSSPSRSIYISRLLKFSEQPHSEYLMECKATRQGTFSFSSFFSQSLARCKFQFPIFS